MIPTIAILCFVGLVFVAFRVVRIRLTPVSATVTSLIGLFLLGTIGICWNLSAPMTDQVVLRRRVLQIIPDVQEFVSEVYVESNQQVSRGDPLFEINPARYQQAVNQASAELETATSSVSQLNSAVAAAEAGLRKAQADTATAKAELDTAQAIMESDKGAIAQLRFQEATQQYAAAQADDRVAEASLKQTRYSLKAAEHSVDVAQVSLNLANFNLKRCTYTSTVDGRVLNLQITQDTPAARYRFTSIGTVEDESSTAILAIYPQNLLRQVERGNAVEMAFKRRPGAIATGVVDSVIKYTGEGQVLPGALLPKAVDIGSRGYLAVRIVLDDEELARELPLGASGSAAIYTETGESFHVFSKIAVRINTWMNYLPK